jgi:hypothetical protein
VSALATRLEHHPVRWLTAAPLWTSLLAAEDPSPADLDRMQRPALLRMTTDDFMEELAALLADDPAAVARLEAVPKSYRAAPPGAADDHEPAIDHVKLFQPVHGHFNLVAATLVCRIAGLPDKAVDTTAQESASFVLRRVAGGTELAWTDAGWTPVAAVDALGAGEREAPLFPVPYTVGDRTRRLFVGLVPTASTDSGTSAGAASLSPGPGDRTGDPPDRRLEEIDTKLIDPLKAMGISTVPPADPPDLTAQDVAAIARAEAAQRVEASRFLLLDLGDILLRLAPQLWSAVQARRRPTAPQLAAAYDLLRDTPADVDRKTSWLDALLAVWAERDAIWGETARAPAYEVNLARGTMVPSTLRARLVGALPERTAEQRAEPQPPFEAPKLDPRPATRYVIRCVYRRPRCGPLRPDLVSDPSRPFAIASFFDLDAPARPLHIAMPIDTTIAGLRKSPKNVHILMSRELRAQMQRVGDLKKLVNGQLASGDSFDLGMICSFSIPIITICALILLMVIVAVLNIVFFWLPFFRICFPVPVKARG